MEAGKSIIEDIARLEALPWQSRKQDDIYSLLTNIEFYRGRSENPLQLALSLPLPSIRLARLSCEESTLKTLESDWQKISFSDEEEKRFARLQILANQILTHVQLPSLCLLHLTPRLILSPVAASTQQVFKDGSNTSHVTTTNLQKKKKKKKSRRKKKVTAYEEDIHLKVEQDSELLHADDGEHDEEDDHNDDVDTMAVDVGFRIPIDISDESEGSEDISPSTTFSERLTCEQPQKTSSSRRLFGSSIPKEKLDRMLVSIPPECHHHIEVLCEHYENELSSLREHYDSSIQSLNMRLFIANNNIEHLIEEMNKHGITADRNGFI